MIQNSSSSLHDKNQRREKIRLRFCIKYVSTELILCNTHIIYESIYEHFHFINYKSYLQVMLFTLYFGSRLRIFSRACFLNSAISKRLGILGTQPQVHPIIVE